MEIGEAVCVKSGSRKVTEGAVKKDEEGAGFEMMANVVWSDSIIFAASKRILRMSWLMIRFTRR